VVEPVGGVGDCRLERPRRIRRLRAGEALERRVGGTERDAARNVVVGVVQRVLKDGFAGDDGRDIVGEPSSVVQYSLLRDHHGK